MANPFGETIRYRGDATLVRREMIAGQEVGVIRSATNTPFDFRIGFADLAELTGTDAPRELRDAAMTFNGHLLDEHDPVPGDEKRLSRVGARRSHDDGHAGLRERPQAAG